MANVAHSTLTGSELHEPKGADAAGLGTVYVADGAGSGSWNSIGTSAFTGMIADFASPVAPTGWLELDGTVISTATYAGLFAVMSIASSGTRTNGSPIITSIPSTTNMRAGYYVFGTGFTTGLTILSIDSPTQITLTGNASSSGTAAIDGAHTHTVNVTDPGHSHTTSMIRYVNSTFGGSNDGGYMGSVNSGTSSGTALSNTTGITAATVSNGAHTHPVSASGTTTSFGSSTETRPLTLVVMTCIKT